jgi:choline dehydrogenase-like flavoprotein
VNYTAHDLDSLYMADRSSFPNIGVINPSLTAIANAIRVGDHIIERLP